MAEPRLLQVFLGKHGAYEVSVTPVEHALTCTCPGFSSWKRCKHVAYIREHLDETGGYRVDLPEEASAALMQAAANPDEWRAFVLKHAPVVVL